MPDSSPSGPPAPRIDRASLERVLARAAELQSNTSGDTSEEFTEAQLLDLGREVGLSPQHLRQAMAEEQTRSILPSDERGFAYSVIGPSRVGAARTVAGKPADVLAAIDTWMQRQELLIVKRHHADRIVWEARHDFLVGIKRAFKVGGRDYALSQAFEVSATAIAVDDTRVHVALDADFRTNRAHGAQQAAATTVIGAAAAGALVLHRHNGHRRRGAGADRSGHRARRGTHVSAATGVARAARARAVARPAGTSGDRAAGRRIAPRGDRRGSDGSSAATPLTGDSERRPGSRYARRRVTNSARGVLPASVRRARSARGCSVRRAR